MHYDIKKPEHPVEVELLLMHHIYHTDSVYVNYILFVKDIFHFIST